MVDLYPLSTAVSRVHEFVSYDHICIMNKLVLVGRLKTLFYLYSVPRIRKKEIGQVVHEIQIIT